MKRLLSTFLGYFLKGIVLIGPLAVTVYLVILLFNAVDNILPWFKQIAPGIGFGVIIVMITVAGYFGSRFFLVRWIMDAVDTVMEHTPGIKYVYTSVKEVLNSFMGDKKKFHNPVWVRTGMMPEIWRIGFLTQNDLSSVEQPGKVAVYLPHSYAISGWVIIVDIAETRPVVGMNAAEAMKFAVSGGVAGMIKDEPVS